MNELIETIEKLQKKKNIPIIYICGLGGSGKTTIAKELANKVQCSACVIHSDWYISHSTIERSNKRQEAIKSGDIELIAKEENPQNWYEWDVLIQDILQLQKTGSLLMKNGWNQSTGENDLVIEEHLPEDGIIIVDGIYLLDGEIAKISDLTILLDTSFEICSERQTKRDKHRNSPEHLQKKRDITKKYDIPYFEKYAKNAHFVFTQYDSSK